MAAKRLVVSWSTRRDRLLALDALVKKIDAAAQCHVNRSQVINILFDVLVARKKLIRATNVVDRASLRDELERVLLIPAEDRPRK